jgi:hypothetical protein
MRGTGVYKNAHPRKRRFNLSGRTGASILAYLLLIIFLTFTGCKSGFTPDELTPIIPWVCTFGGAGDLHANAMATDNLGNMYITGYFFGTADFDPGPAEENHKASGSQDVFLTKFDSYGNYQWSRTWGVETVIYMDEPLVDDAGNGVAADDYCNIFVTGCYAGERGDDYFEYPYTVVQIASSENTPQPAIFSGSVIGAVITRTDVMRWKWMALVTFISTVSAKVGLTWIPGKAR